MNTDSIPHLRKALRGFEQGHALLCEIIKRSRQAFHSESVGKFDPIVASIEFLKEIHELLREFKRCHAQFVKHATAIQADCDEFPGFINELGQEVEVQLAENAHPWRLADSILFTYGNDSFVLVDKVVVEWAQAIANGESLPWDSYHAAMDDHAAIWIKWFTDQEGKFQESLSTGEHDLRPANFLGLGFCDADRRLCRDGYDEAVLFTDSPLLWGLVCALAKSGDTPLPPERQRAVWASHGMEDNPTDATITDAISKLRKRLNPLDVDVESVRRLGRRLRPVQASP